MLLTIRSHHLVVVAVFDFTGDPIAPSLLHCVQRRPGHLDPEYRRFSTTEDSSYILLLPKQIRVVLPILHQRIVNHGSYMVFERCRTIDQSLGLCRHGKLNHVHKESDYQEANQAVNPTARRTEGFLTVICRATTVTAECTNDATFVVSGFVCWKIVLILRQVVTIVGRGVHGPLVLQCSRQKAEEIYTHTYT